VGRLAEYRYYDIDDIVKRALEIFEDKIKWAGPLWTIDRL
jgi:UDP-galactopyranose mutase